MKDFEYYYDILKNIPTEELIARQDDEEYCNEYRYVCKKIIEARARGEEQEPKLDVQEFNNEMNIAHELASDREVPCSLDECRKLDKTSKALLALSEKVEKMGGIILVLIIILGIAISVMSGIVEGEMGDSELDVFYFLSNLSIWIIYAAIEYGVYNIIALLLTALASIVHSNRITSNIALYNASKEKQKQR